MFVPFLFVQQKTAYELRISDWSSDVCSSDLLGGLVASDVAEAHEVQRVGCHHLEQWVGRDPLGERLRQLDVVSHDATQSLGPVAADHEPELQGAEAAARSEERRVGKECVSTCRSRWSPYH